MEYFSLLNMVKNYDAFSFWLAVTFTKKSCLDHPPCKEMSHIQIGYALKIYSRQNHVNYRNTTPHAKLYHNASISSLPRTIGAHAPTPTHIWRSRNAPYN
jgi:hypothetical protein